MKSKRMLLAIILLFGCLPHFLSDVYMPSLPAIAESLETSVGLSQWTMAIYMVSYALSMLVYGPISEGVGRRKPLLFGLVIITIGSTICMLAPNIELLLIGRFVQGCGAGACNTTWRSVFRDSFQGPQLAKYSSYLVIVVTMILPAAPILGGYLQMHFGWRSVFICMTLIVLFTTIMVYTKLPETSKHHHPERLKLAFILPATKSLLTSPIFMGYTVIVFLCFGAMFAWITSGPILFINELGLTPVQFGWINFAMAAICMSLSGFVNSRMVERFGTQFMLRKGILLMLLSGLLLALGHVFVGMNLIAIVAPLCLFFYGATFIWPSAFSGAFAPFGHISGYAGAWYGLMQIGGAACLGGLVAHLPETNQLPLAVIICSSATLGWLLFELVVRRAEQQLQ